MNDTDGGIVRSFSRSGFFIETPGKTGASSEFGNEFRDGVNSFIRRENIPKTVGGENSKRVLIRYVVGNDVGIGDEEMAHGIIANGSGDGILAIDSPSVEENDDSASIRYSFFLAILAWGVD